MYYYVIYDNYPQSGKAEEIIKRVGGFKTEEEADASANNVLDRLGDDRRYGYNVLPF